MLAMDSPRAAALMHRLVAYMGHQNAVLISVKTLAKVMGCNERTIRRAIDDLEKGQWIQVVQIGPTGTCNAYIINDRVAWGESRDHMARLSAFSAQIIADAGDQTETTLGRTPLRKLPIVYPPEEALPHGDGEPGAQMILPGLEPVIVGQR
jgi:hypothetical protein